MGLFDKIREPVFLKEDSIAEKQLAALEALQKELGIAASEAIEQEIKLVKAGIYGEQQVSFELRNSHIPMFVLHDLFIKQGDLTAQIDYLIVTRCGVLVLECKNLLGNIEVNNRGEFTRTLTFGKCYRKEGIYSPITQNRRHLELIKQLRSNEKENIILRTIFERSFYDNYKAVVVLSNPTSTLEMKYAPKEIKQQVIRADQLVEYIRRLNANSEQWSEKSMEELAQYFLSKNVQERVDYTAKWRERLEAEEPEISPEKKQAEDACPQCGKKLVERVAKQGVHAGQSFMGCTGFPQCHYMRWPEAQLQEEQTKPLQPAITKESGPEQTEQRFCPKCGKPLVKRVAKKGTNAGNVFWGCSGFPGCRYIEG